METVVTERCYRCSEFVHFFANGIRQNPEFLSSFKKYELLLLEPEFAPNLAY